MIMTKVSFMRWHRTAAASGPRESDLVANTLLVVWQYRTGAMAHATDVLVWMDMEMTGLDPERERIIEVATILTDGALNEIAVGPEMVIHQPDEVLAAMDDWNRKHHRDSGLVEKVRQSAVSEAEAEAAMVAFLDEHVPVKERPILAGNSIHQDRRFIVRYMPRLDKRLHYRMVDVSSIKELARRWYPASLATMPAKRESHRALDDVRESIEELRCYRQRIFAPAPVPAADATE
jgi:oligoribonuclease